MKRGSAFIEYAIILGVVGAALLAMNIYMKRGLQGRVKDMADNFINAGESAQVTEIDPQVQTTSNVEAVSSAQLSDRVAFGGGKSATVVESSSIVAESITRDTGRVPTKPGSDGFTPAEAGEVVAPMPENNQQQGR